VGVGAAAAPGRGAGVPQEQLREVGRDWGRYLAGRPGPFDPRQRLPEILGRLGYDASVAGDEVHLTRCPCPLIAPDRPRTICELADGVVDGVLGAAGSELRTGSAEHDPPRRDCCITLVER
jgi:predicted ArsR family transcriptional regulator